MTTSPLGLLDVDSLIGEEERAMQQTVRQFVDDRIRPHVAEWYESGSTPVRDLALELGEIGALGMHLEGYGCTGASATAYGLACLEVEAGDSGVRSLMSVQGSLAMFAIWKHGSEEQKEEWLPQMAKGEKIGCFGLTEPDFGSNPAGMRTRAKRDGSDWVLAATRCGSPTARSPTSRSSGPRPTTGSAASSYPPTPRASRPRTSSRRCRCARR